MESLASAGTLEALLSLPSFTDRMRAEEMLKTAAGKIRQKTALSNILKAAYKEFIQKQRESDARLTEFSSLPEGIDSQLYCGQFEAVDAGVYFNDYADSGGVSKLRVCSHPLMPIEYLEGIEDGLHRVRLAFQRGGRWRTITERRSVVASRQNIVNLSSYGIDVTSETGRYLVQYLSDIESANETRIPRSRSIGRLGWVVHGGADGPVFDFSPYIDQIRFDGEESYRDLFSSVCEQGSFDEWLRVMRPVRTRGGIPRMILAASFAAPIVGLLGGLPFFFHIWGNTEGGKTVSLMTAASVWGDPNLGRLVRSFNSTKTGMELLAAFLRNLPLCLDELQTARDRSGDFDGVIYMLGEGQGGTRANRDGSVRRVNQWRTVILTNGEQPITTDRSGGGAKNRVLEAELSDVALYEDPRDVAETVKLHYGHAGGRFIQALQRMGPEAVRAQYNNAVADIKSISESTDKQNLSVAYLLLADQIAATEIFHDEPISPYAFLSILTDKEDVNTFRRTLDHVNAWIAGNPHRFKVNPEHETEIWGRETDTGSLAIIGTVLSEELTRAGFSYRAFLAMADKQGMLEKDGDGKRTKLVRVTHGGVSCRCVVLQKNLGQTRL